MGTAYIPSYYTGDTLLDTYIDWTREDGFCVRDRNTASSESLRHALKKYVPGMVLEEIKPLIPELVQTTLDRSLKIFKGDAFKELRELYRSFYEAYNSGEKIQVECFTFQKKMD